MTQFTWILIPAKGESKLEGNVDVVHYKDHSNVIARDVPYVAALNLLMQHHAEMKALKKEFETKYKVSIDPEPLDL